MKTFHDGCTANNIDQIASNLQVICLKSQLFGRCIDLCSSNTTKQFTGEHFVDIDINVIYKSGGLSVDNEAYRHFNDLLSTRREDKESIKGFELRFPACVAAFNAISDSTKLPQRLTALTIIFIEDVTGSVAASV